jgi:hypothetical protein
VKRIYGISRVRRQLHSITKYELFPRHVASILAFLESIK